MKSDINFGSLWAIVAEQFPLGPNSDHGPDHWRRVEENGLLLAMDTGADITVVRLFALFHDSRRESDFSDPEHGKRGTEYARKLHGIHFVITDLQFDLLEAACTWHTDTMHHHDPTIGSCWDADRLDLRRVGIIPDAKYMNTDLGRQLANKISRERIP
jgi:uncharacterized protein